MFNSDIQRTLRGIIREYGSEICEPPSRVRGFLNDLCPGQTAEINLLITSLTACRLAYFQAVKKGQAERLLAVRIDTLQYDLSITREAAHWAVETWALALGVVEAPLPRSVCENSQAANLPSPGAAPTLATVAKAIEIPLTLSLPEMPLTAAAVPSTPVSSIPATNSQRLKRSASPAALIGVGAAVFVLILWGLIALLAGNPRPSPAFSSAESPAANISSPAPIDPAAGRAQSLAQRIQEIRSGFDPKTTLVWPLNGRDNGMKIVLPPKRNGVSVSLLGYADLQHGCEVLRGQFEQALRDSGYSESDIAGCSVFVCASNGDQLAFSTKTY